MDRKRIEESPSERARVEKEAADSLAGKGSEYWTNRPTPEADHYFVLKEARDIVDGYSDERPLPTHLKHLFDEIDKLRNLIIELTKLMVQL